MTAYDYYEKAMLAAGYCDSEGRIDNSHERAQRAIVAVNAIAFDLKLDIRIKELFDEIKLTDSQSEALVFGIGMLMSLGDGDSEKNIAFTALYNAKRASAKATRTMIKDNLPKTEGGF